MKQLTCFLALGSSLVISCQDRNAEENKPNILFILSDDHARTAISAYGGIYAETAPTPNIDYIAEHGAIFRNMLCTNAISGPSRACLLTGKYSTENGFYQNEGGLVFNGDQQQLQKVLKANGYTTSLFGKWHLYSTPQGFDYFMIHDNTGQQGLYWDPIYNTNGVRDTLKGYCTTITASSALKWLDKQRDKSKPFCMMLNFKAPHRSWEPDSCYVDLYDDVEFPYPDTFDDDYSSREMTMGRSMAKIACHLSRGDMKMKAPDNLSPREKEKWLWYGGSGDNQFWTPDPEMSAEELKKWKFQRYIKDYFRCIKSVDDQVGNVIGYLRKEKLLDNTIIIYMGDQGFYLGEHGLYDKRWMYETSLQMPCLISYPARIKPGTEINEMTLNIDLAPTLIDFAGLCIPEDMQGESFKELLLDHDNAATGWRQSMYYQYFEYPKWHRVQPHYGVRTDRYKLIHFYFDMDLWEFYDLQKDPHELVNRYDDPEYKDIIKNLHEELERLIQKYDPSISDIEKRKELTKARMKKYDY